MSGGPVSAQLEAINRRPFGRPEAAFYEAVAAPAVRDIVLPVLLDALAGAPAGPVLDVGCGGGAIARGVAATGRVAVGVDPSVPQVARLGRGGGGALGVAAGAERLPFADGRFAAVVSSCAIKHWPARAPGLAECRRVLAPGGRITVVEIDGGDDPGDLLRFAARARIPRGLHRAYRAFARRSFVPVSPTAAAVVADLDAAGFVAPTHRRLDGLPFFVVSAARPGAT